MLTFPFRSRISTPNVCTRASRNVRGRCGLHGHCSSLLPWHLYFRVQKGKDICQTVHQVIRGRREVGRGPWKARMLTAISPRRMHRVLPLIKQ